MTNWRCHSVFGKCGKSQWYESCKQIMRCGRPAVAKFTLWFCVVVNLDTENLANDYHCPVRLSFENQCTPLLFCYFDKEKRTYLTKISCIKKEGNVQDLCLFVSLDLLQFQLLQCRPFPLSWIAVKEPLSRTLGSDSDWEGCVFSHWAAVVWMRPYPFKLLSGASQWSADKFVVVLGSSQGQ